MTATSYLLLFLGLPATAGVVLLSVTRRLASKRDAALNAKLSLATPTQESAREPSQRFLMTR